MKWVWVLRGCQFCSVRSLGQDWQPQERISLAPSIEPRLASLLGVSREAPQEVRDAVRCVRVTSEMLVGVQARFRCLHGEIQSWVVDGA